MHVDIAIGAELRALPAADAPVLDDDLEIFFSPDRTHRALRHAKRIAARSTRGGDEEMFVTQSITEQSGDTVMRLGACLHACVAARAILEIDEQQILRLEQSLI